jgi:hypothetical protein
MSPMYSVRDLPMKGTTLGHGMEESFIVIARLTILTITHRRIRIYNSSSKINKHGRWTLNNTAKDTTLGIVKKLRDMLVRVHMTVEPVQAVAVG